ncbi:MAG TPA: phosphoribosylformylglycinamidine synthase [Candidatus Poseidoniales archaeon]|nr:phosphoribosylformylglycinamidine synthase [Euryarchaeota archaeon]DAC54341.1 MAG TPA: phosphoribosylformylglycinamidine synthase [Candidatus Poseidoniales archaeon]HII27768.1 phosphoribosylformylglycinamidine synthase [Poseidonia sp.]
MPVTRVEVTPRQGDGMRDVRGDVVRRQLAADHGLSVATVRSICGYLIHGETPSSAVAPRVDDLFADPIIEHGLTNTMLLTTQSFATSPDAVITVGFKPGVTDNPGKAATDGFLTLFPNDPDARISTYLTYVFYGLPQDCDVHWLADTLHNNLIERALVADRSECHAKSWPELDFPTPPEQVFIEPQAVDLEVDDARLEAISNDGLLALNLNEMHAIQAHYRDEAVRAQRTSMGISPNAPTDVELECLAQTWSEHCKHKIFASKIHHVDHETGEDSVIDSLFKTHIMTPTHDMQEDVDWLLSVFHDNSGVIAWDDTWSVCMKAETHNSPSALDPYGGAMTGIVGVNRDILGTGLGARPIANTDVFCFGPPDWEGQLPENLFHPSRVLRGVHAGVRVGGNESGIPTVNGAIVFDDRYIGKPLVYCGTVGIMPRTLPDGRPSHVKTPVAGDVVYMVGGRVGYDGIHGATFSSLELTEESPSSAVQIGDPITQKKMIDMVLEARDSNLITCITDNGAGGLSSSIGEMAEYTNGCEIDLAKVPLKQAGLSPWEILVSESQERMTIAVKPEDQEAFEALADLHEVEATAVATFTSTGMFHVRYDEATVAYLPIEFLHDGVPQLQLESEWRPPVLPLFVPPQNADHAALLTSMLKRPNIASKETWVRQYDHEVIAQTAIKPFVGVERDGPGDAGVIAPIHGDPHGLVISCGIAPRYSDIDAGAMAAASIDEAVRNAVCVGLDVDKMAGLDNFCWPDPIESSKTPDGRFKLAQLVRANRELERVCRAYRLPCVSGKDSMKNDYGSGPNKISIPPTLLFSLFGDHPDVRQSATSDFKFDGDRIYLVGTSNQELGASELAFMLTESGVAEGVGGDVPQLPHPERNLGVYRALATCVRAGWVRTAHDCSEGGVAVALAEMCIGGRIGAVVDIDGTGTGDVWGRLWGESLGRFIVAVSPEHESAFLEAMKGHPTTVLGQVRTGMKLVITDADDALITADVETLVDAWKGTLDLTGGVA